LDTTGGTVGNHASKAIAGKMGRPVVCLMLACLTMALVACGGSNDNSPSAAGGQKKLTSPQESPSSGGGGQEETTSKTIDGQQVNFKKAANVSSKSSIEVEADDFYFSPTVLTGKPGQTLTLELKNEGSATHNFTLAEQNISQDLAPDQTAEVKVKFPKSGTLLFHCKFHESGGMRGALQTSS
jgi:plastocyanin